MPMHYSEKARETDAHALPDVEVWYEDRASVRVDDGGSAQWTEPGWYWWTCFPGCLPDSDAFGPFETEAEALKDARKASGLCEHGTSDDEPCDECAAPELWVLQNPANGARLVFTTVQGLRCDAPVSCWSTKEHAERQAKILGLDAFMQAVRLGDDEARAWGFDTEALADAREGAE